MFAGRSGLSWLDKFHVSTPAESKYQTSGKYFLRLSWAPVWGWYTPHHFLVPTIWSQPPSGLSWLELFSVPCGQYGRIQQPLFHMSQPPLSVHCAALHGYQSHYKVRTPAPRLAAAAPSHLRSVYYEGWRAIIVLIDVIQKCSATQSWAATIQTIMREGWS